MLLTTAGPPLSTDALRQHCRTARWRNPSTGRRVEPAQLKKDAPNVLIVLLDDVGFGQSDTFGGEIHTPTLSRLRDAGISYNCFHTTSICSPTRAALLTGRNHHAWATAPSPSGRRLRRLHGMIPKTSATDRRGAAPLRLPVGRVRQVAQHTRQPDHGDGAIRSLAHRTRVRLFLRLPCRRDIAVGTAALREPQPVEPPHSEKYHLSEDLAEKAVTWFKRHQAFSPDKPFFLYWAPGAGHGPHHIFKEWADKYKGKFDDGWDDYRERVFNRQKEMGWIPADTQLTLRDENDARLGQHPRIGTTLPAPPDGSLCRLCRARRYAGRQGGRWARSPRHPRQYDRHLHLGRQRLQRRGPERQHQRTARPEQHPQHDRATNRGTRTRSAAWMPSAARKSTTCITRAGHGPATRPSSPPNSLPRTSAARGTRWSSPGPKASGRTRRRDRSFTTSTTSCRRSTRSSASSRPKIVNGFKQDPMDGVSLAYTFANPMPREEEDAVFRQQRQPRHLPRWLVRLHIRPVDPLADTAELQASRSGTRTRTPGNFTTSTEVTFRSPMTWLPRSRSVLPHSRTLRPEARDNKVYPLGGGHLAASAPGGPHQVALPQLDLRHHNDADARVLCAGSWAARATSSPWKLRLARTPRESCTRLAARAAA